MGAKLKRRDGANMVADPTLIVFDCDGTLADSQYVITESMRAAFQTVDLAAPKRSAIVRTIGLSLPEAMESLVPDQCSAVKGELVRSYREKCSELRQSLEPQERMFDGAAPLLMRLASREDFILGLATGKSRRGAMRFIELNKLDGVFATIQTADNAMSKPHPDMLWQAMRETGVSADAAIMVGDTTHDMLMAASAKVAGIGVTWGYHSVAQLQRAGAKMIARNFAALSKALEGREITATSYETVS